MIVDMEDVRFIKRTWEIFKPVAAFHGGTYRVVPGIRLHDGRVARIEAIAVDFRQLPGRIVGSYKDTEITVERTRGA